MVKIGIDIWIYVNTRICGYYAPFILAPPRGEGLLLYTVGLRPNPKSIWNLVSPCHIRAGGGDVFEFFRMDLCRDLRYEAKCASSLHGSGCCACVQKWVQNEPSWTTFNILPPLSYALFKSYCQIYIYVHAHYVHWSCMQAHYVHCPCMHAHIAPKFSCVHPR